MKKMFLAAFAAGLAFLMFSCNPVPTKELEQAKAAIEKAESVEAPFYAAGEYKTAKDDFDSANQLVEDKKNKDAKAKALSSKEQAVKAFDIANAKRAADVYNKDKNLLMEAGQNFGELLKPEEYRKAQADFDALSTVYASSNHSLTYTNGMKLFNELTDLVKYLKGKTDQARNAIAEAQDKYDQAENNDIVREFAMDELKMAIPLLEEARAAFEKGDLETAIAKADAAKAQVQKANDKAQEEYEKYLEQQRQQQLQMQLDQQKQKEKEKVKADEYLKKAQEMLERIKNENSQAPTAPQKLGAVRAPFLAVGQTLEIIDENEEEAVEPIQVDVSEEEVTQELVEKYYQLAKDAFDRGEYLDSVDYSREAIRLGEIYLARKNMNTYTVIDKPGDEDCLWKIAGKMYDREYWMWPIIWRANKFKIADPDLIYPGQVFDIPPSLMK